MSSRLALAAVAALGLASFSGCGPATLNEEKTYTIDTGDVNALDLTAQKKAQKITVTFESTKGDVDVLLFKAEDAAGEDGMRAADSSKALGKAGGKEGTFSADVPENTATRVVIRNSRVKTDVKLKVTNKQ